MKRLLILFAFISCQSSSTPEEMIDVHSQVINQYVIDRDTTLLRIGLTALDRTVRLHPTAKNIAKGQYLLDKQDSLFSVALRQ